MQIYSSFNDMFVDNYGKSTILNKNDFEDTIDTETIQAKLNDVLKGLEAVNSLGGNIKQFASNVKKFQKLVGKGGDKKQLYEQFYALKLDDETYNQDIKRIADEANTAITAILSELGDSILK